MLGKKLLGFRKLNECIYFHNRDDGALISTTGHDSLIDIELDKDEIKKLIEFLSKNL